MNFDIVDEIKTKIDIVQLVSSYINLKKSGANYKGLCPFHKEKTPSFMVSPEKGIAYCFGCHKGGDIFKFIELIENVDFKEAIKILAERANIDTTKISFIPNENKDTKDKLKEILQITKSEYIKNLQNNEKSIDYLKNKRQLKDDIIKEFEIGYAENSYHKILEKLKSHNYKEKDIYDAGLVVSKDLKMIDLYDKFRDRIIFPINDNFGNTLGFSGRSMQNIDKIPKYLNSPDTPIFNKSTLLYNMDKAKTYIKEEDFVIITEGFFDVITLYQNNIKNVVAVCGTALTKDHIKLISRYTKNIYFFFDNDTAGLDACIRNSKEVLNQGLNLYIIIYKDAKDPDEYILKYGINDLKTIINTPILFFDYIFDIQSQNFKLDNITGKKKFIQFVFEFILLLKTEIEKEEWLKRLSNFLDINFEALKTDFKNSKKTIKKNEYDKECKIQKFDILKYILGILKVFETNDIFIKIKKELLNFDLLENNIQNTEEENLKIYALFIEKEYENKLDDIDFMFNECKKFIFEYKKQLFKNKQNDYLEKLKNCINENEHTKIFEQYNDFLIKHKNLSNV